MRFMVFVLCKNPHIILKPTTDTEDFNSYNMQYKIHTINVVCIWLANN